MKYTTLAGLAALTLATCNTTNITRDHQRTSNAPIIVYVEKGCEVKDIMEQIPGYGMVKEFLAEAVCVGKTTLEELTRYDHNFSNAEKNDFVNNGIKPPVANWYANLEKIYHNLDFSSDQIIKFENMVKEGIKRTYLQGIIKEKAQEEQKKTIWDLLR